MDKSSKLEELKKMNAELMLLAKEMRKASMFRKAEIAEEMLDKQLRFNLWVLGVFCGSD